MMTTVVSTINLQSAVNSVSTTIICVLSLPLSLKQRLLLVCHAKWSARAPERRKLHETKSSLLSKSGAITMRSWSQDYKFGCRFVDLELIAASTITHERLIQLYGIKSTTLVSPFVSWISTKRNPAFVHTYTCINTQTTGHSCISTSVHCLRWFIIHIEIRQQTRQTTKFVLGICFTMPQSFCMKIPFTLKSPIRI